MKKLGILAILLVLGMAGIAYGATFTTPLTGGLISGTATINATNSTYKNLVNCTVTGSSALTGGSFSSAGALTNVSIWSRLTGTYETTEVVDSTDWILTGTCYNETGGVSETITAITVTIDNTVPVCTHSLSSGTSYKPTQTWTVTATNSTSCTLQFGSNAALTMTETSDVCTYTGNINTITKGFYTVKATTSDGTNTTSCSLENVRIDPAATVKQVAVILAQQPKKGAEVVTTSAPANNKNMMYVGLAVLALILISRNKKK